MNNKLWQHFQLLPLTLMGAMMLTRFHHFGSAFSLPDSSLAVFFLAGMGFSRPWFFILLLLEAGMIDYLAITQFSVSDFCISPAYVGLIPTYGVMWFAGRYCNLYKSLHFADSLKAFGVASIATTAAFAFSNGSFYLFSGRFGALSWHQYLSQTTQYFPAYFSSALIYIVIGLAVVKLWKASHSMSAVES